jgi:hypothetical protein
VVVNAIVLTAARQNQSRREPRNREPIISRRSPLLDSLGVLAFDVVLFLGWSR